MTEVTPSPVQSNQPPAFGVTLAVVFVVTGALLGLLGGFLQAVTVGAGPAPMPVGALLVVATLVAGIRALTHTYDTRKAGVAFFAGWAVTSIVLALPWPGGDVVIGRNAIAMGYLFGGAIVASAAANLPARLRPPAPSGSVDQ